MASTNSQVAQFAEHLRGKPLEIGGVFSKVIETFAVFYQGDDIVRDGVGLFAISICGGGKHEIPRQCTRMLFPDDEAILPD
jgi:hypothetical protein